MSIKDVEVGKIYKVVAKQYSCIMQVLENNYMPKDNNDKNHTLKVKYLFKSWNDNDDDYYYGFSNRNHFGCHIDQIVTVEEIPLV